jgi:hypothetical protein
VVKLAKAIARPAASGMVTAAMATPEAHKQAVVQKRVAETQAKVAPETTLTVVALAGP